MSGPLNPVEQPNDTKPCMNCGVPVPRVSEYRGRPMQWLGSSDRMCPKCRRKADRDAKLQEKAYEQSEVWQLREAEWKAAQRRYWPGFTVPRKLPANGRVIVHNRVQPVRIDQCHGENGFRVWTQNPSNILLAPCGCGWSGLPHYRVRWVEKPCRIGGPAFQRIFGKVGSHE
jgi:hypothetical protein